MKDIGILMEELLKTQGCEYKTKITDEKGFFKHWAYSEYGCLQHSSLNNTCKYLRIINNKQYCVYNGGKK